MIELAHEITLSNVELTHFFFAIVLLLISAHFLGYLFQYFKFPRVIGEICGGLVLGPTVLGYFAPHAQSWLFSAFSSEGQLISIIYWFGLMFLMFVSGFEIQKTFNKEDRRIIIVILIGATVIPFAIGWLAPLVYNFSPFLGPSSNMLALRIVLAIAFAVTSIPVISKIFIDLDIVDTLFAKIVLSTATMHDVILWVALAIATGLVHGNVISLPKIISYVVLTVAFFLVLLLLVPKLIRLCDQSRYNFLLKSSAPGYILLICLVFASLASILNINIVFGAFLAGVVVGLTADAQFQIKKAKETVKDIAMAFFIPLYFAIVGLKLDLIHHLNLAFFLGFLLFSSFVSVGGTFLVVKLMRKSYLESFNLGMAMNTRGGPGIVLATVAFDIGIISEDFFVALVLTAMITSFITGYWLKTILSRGWVLLNDSHFQSCERETG